MRSNQFNIKTVFAVLISTTLFSSVSCSSEEKRSEKIRVVDFTYNMPILDPQGMVANVGDTVRIFQIGDDMIYRLSTIDLRYLNNKLIGQSKNYEYFLYNFRDSTGTYYDTLLKPHPQRIGVDSALGKRVFYHQNVGDMHEEILVDQEANVDGYDLTERYKAKDRGPDAYEDSMYVYYKKSLNNFHHSISDVQDAKNNLKVARLRIIYLPKRYSGLPGVVNRREFLFDMQEKFDFDIKQVGELVTKLRKSRLK